jgi:hypothetical protein
LNNDARTHTDACLRRVFVSVLHAHDQMGFIEVVTNMSKYTSITAS